MQRHMTAADRYRQLESAREPFLRRARRCAALTIPALMPPEGYGPESVLPQPYQSVGARGVNNLASKLTLTMLPPNRPFFRVLPAFMDLDELKQSNPDLATEFETALGKYERAVQVEIDSSGDRVGWNEASKHLIVCGNVVIEDLNEGGLKVYSLDKFVQKCDPAGNVLEIVIKESIDPLLLPESVQLKEESDPTGRRKVDLYTWVKRQKDHWTVHQEVENKIIPGSHGTYPLDSPAFISLSFSDKNGQDYSRSYVEEYIGDLISLDGLANAILDGAVGSARGLVFVNPNGLTKMSDVAKAPNWAVRPGRSEDVTVLQANKTIDLQVAEHRATQLQRDLEFAFLLNSSIQRDAERVTAEEIRFMAQELETIMGGQYTILSSTFQMPYIRRKIHKMERQRKLPVLPKKLIRITIITGLDALGRTADLQRIDMAFSIAQKHLGADVVAQSINVDNYLATIFTASGVDKEGLIKSQEQMMQEQQQAQMQAMAHQLTPEMVKQFGGLTQQAIKQSQGGSNG